MRRGVSARQNEGNLCRKQPVAPFRSRRFAANRSLRGRGRRVAAPGAALADDVVGNVLPFVAALPRDDNEVVAFLKAQCSTDCGAAGAKGLYLEVAESEDWKGPVSYTHLTLPTILLV